MSNIEGFYADGEQTQDAPSNDVAENLSDNESDEEPMPSEGGEMKMKHLRLLTKNHRKIMLPRTTK